jgi:hypothetical protein
MTASPRRGREQPTGSRAVDRDGLLDDNVLSRLHDRESELDMGLVRCADVHHIDARVVEHGSKVDDGALDAERPGCARAAIRVAVNDRHDIRVTATADGVDMVRPDETGADDGGSQSARPDHVHQALLSRGSLRWTVGRARAKRPRRG